MLYYDRITERMIVMKKVMSALLPGAIAALVCREIYTIGFNKGMKEANKKWHFAINVNETVKKKYEKEES
jgi:hypothetical protein